MKLWERLKSILQAATRPQTQAPKAEVSNPPRPKITVAGFDASGQPTVKQVEAPQPQPRCQCATPLRQAVSGGYRCGQCGGAL